MGNGMLSKKLSADLAGCYDAGNGWIYALQKNPGTGIGAGAFSDCACAGGRQRGDMNLEPMIIF